MLGVMGANTDANTGANTGANTCALTGAEKLSANTAAADGLIAAGFVAAEANVDINANLWQLSCERLIAELPEQQFNTWIRPLPPAVIADGGAAGGLVVSLRVPNRFKLDWIRNQYAGRIESILSDLAGRPARLDLALASRDTPIRPSPAAASGTTTQPSSPQTGMGGQVLHNGLRPVVINPGPALTPQGGNQGVAPQPPPAAAKLSSQRQPASHQ